MPGGVVSGRTRDYRGDGINNPLSIVSYLLHVKFLFHPSSAKHEDQARRSSLRDSPISLYSILTTRVCTFSLHYYGALVLTNTRVGFCITRVGARFYANK